jgi:probable HAF family extracellular repeat protein
LALYSIWQMPPYQARGRFFERANCLHKPEKTQSIPARVGLSSRGFLGGFVIREQSRAAQAAYNVTRSTVALMATLITVGYCHAEVRYGFTTVDVPHASRTAINGNTAHALAGEYDDAASTTHGFVAYDHQFKTIDVPQATYTSVNGINDHGDLAGIYVKDRRYAFFSQNGRTTTLDPPGAILSQGGFVNNHRQVVGAFRTSDQKRHGFVWRAGRFDILNVPNDHPLYGTVALGINDYSDVAGNYVDATGVRHGFLLSRGSYTTLDPAGSVLTVAEGVNNNGVVVGLYLDASGVQHGFVWTHGTYTTVDAPRSLATGIYSINALGEIVGTYDDLAGVGHGFVAKPEQSHMAKQ